MLLPVLAEITVACCNCVDSTIKNYSHHGLSVFNLDNSGERPVVTLDTSIPKNAYGIQLDLIRGLVAFNRTSPGFFQSAYAFSCECPPEFHIKPKDEIQSIEIFTVNDFDDIHSAGLEVTDYFRMMNNGNLITLADYLESMKGTDSKGNSGWSIYNEGDLRLRLTLLLMEAPSMGTTHQFEVKINLSDGRTLEQLTTVIILN